MLALERYEFLVICLTRILEKDCGTFEIPPPTKIYRAVIVMKTAKRKCCSFLRKEVPKISSPTELRSTKNRTFTEKIILTSAIHHLRDFNFSFLFDWDLLGHIFVNLNTLLEVFITEAALLIVSWLNHCNIPDYVSNQSGRCSLHSCCHYHFL